MTFSMLRPNVIASDEGFSVEVLGRTGIEYKEGGRSLFVDSEVLIRGIAVFTLSIKTWRPPYENELLSVQQKNRIIENIRRAIEFTGEPAEIV